MNEISELLKADTNGLNQVKLNKDEIPDLNYE